MLAKERQKKIEKMLAEHGAVLVSELVSRFGVSIETVRRDLLTMEAEEKCVRDENIITAAGAGVAMEFGLKIIETLLDKESADKIKNAIIAS